MRQAQVNIMTAAQLLATAQIENDAIGTFTDMHLNGNVWLQREKDMEVAHNLTAKWSQGKLDY